MTRGDLCILVPTCDSNAWVAAFTTRLLDRFWPTHPPLFTCGTGTPLAEGSPLELRSHPSDWMSIAHDAVGDLGRRGLKAVYLVLDDHPPIGPCSAEHLNETLPSLLGELGGSYIGLNGWGQGRSLQGEKMGPERYFLEKVPASFPWRFSLHPGLWNLSDLELVLETLLRGAGAGERTAWAFERRSGKPANMAETEERLGGAYRVFGESMTNPECRLARPLLLASARRLAGLCSRGTRIAGLRQTADDIDSRARFLYRYYRGPYPLYWSGFLQKGSSHGDMLRFLRLFDGSGLAGEFREHARSHGKAP